MNSNLSKDKKQRRSCWEDNVNLKLVITKGLIDLNEYFKNKYRRDITKGKAIKYKYYNCNKLLKYQRYLILHYLFYSSVQAKYVNYPTHINNKVKYLLRKYSKIGS